jgi:UDP-N-acetylmuramoylalanine--D-glutamate ligase
VANVMTGWELAARSCSPGAASVEALKAFPGLANRMERIGERGGVLVVNNSMCTNPAAVVASSRGLRRRQHLLMGGVTKNLDFTPVADYLRGSGHRAYLFGPDNDTLAKTLGEGWPRFETMEAAFGAAVSAAVAGCASAEPYANFRERGDAFREMARAWLEAGQ